ISAGLLATADGAHRSPEIGVGHHPGGTGGNRREYPDGHRHAEDKTAADEAQPGQLRPLDDLSAADADDVGDTLQRREHAERGDKRAETKIGDEIAIDAADERRR